MSKLSKQDKIEIYHLWHDYQISPAELSQRYRVGRSNINYLLALIGRHGLAILDQPFTAYTSNFKEQALRRIIVNHEPLYHVALDLGLKSRGMLSNWLREYRKMGIISLISREDDRPMTKREQLIKQENHRLKQENERLRQQNLKLKIENEFVKKLSVLVDQRTKNRKPRK